MVDAFVGNKLGLRDGARLGGNVGNPVGSSDSGAGVRNKAVGNKVGLVVGPSDGFAVGTDVGEAVGANVGNLVRLVGCLDGLAVGWRVCARVG